MKKPVLLTIVLTTWSFQPSVAEEVQAEAFRRLTDREASVPILEAGSQVAATGLQARSECSSVAPGLGVATLRWEAGQAGSGSQRIDITEFREGFDTSRFQASAEISASRVSAALQAPTPGINYYWRVLRRTPAGWVPSPIGRFSGPVCPTDIARPSEPSAGLR